MSQVTYEIDPTHSSVHFSVRHLMVSNVRGEFTKVTGTIRFDAENPAASTVEAAIDASSINTRDTQRDAHLKSADFLDVEKFPTLTFRSKQVEPHRGRRKGERRFDDSRSHPRDHAGRGRASRRRSRIPGESSESEPPQPQS